MKSPEHEKMGLEKKGVTSTGFKSHLHPVPLRYSGQFYHAVSHPKAVWKGFFFFA
jgi:hypothetical protein